MSASPENLSKQDFRKEFLEQLEATGASTKETMVKAHEHYKKAHDDRVRVRKSDIFVGDLVLLRRFEQPSGLSPKLLSLTGGPHLFLAKMGMLEGSARTKSIIRLIRIEIPENLCQMICLMRLTISMEWRRP